MGGANARWSKQYNDKTSRAPGNMTEFLVGTDRHRRRLARRVLHQLIIAGVLAAVCSSAYANCSESERKFIIGPHFAAPVPKPVDGPPPLVFCNLPPHETIRVTSLML